MKHLLFVLLSMTLSCCVSNVGNKNLELSENDVYELINNHVIKQVTPEGESNILWSLRMISGPKIDSNYDDQLFPPVLPFHSFSQENWNEKKLKGIQPISWNEYQLFFDTKDSINPNVKWDEKYQDRFLHLVSFPEVIPGTMTVVVKHILKRPYVPCGTGLSHEFYYVKTETGWTER